MNGKNRKNIISLITLVSLTLMAVVAIPCFAQSLSTAKIMVYDPDDEILNYLENKGLSAIDYDSAQLSSQDILILGEGALKDSDYPSRLDEITNFVQSGHSLIVIEPSFGVAGDGYEELEVINDDIIVKVKGQSYRGYESYVFIATDPTFELWNGIGPEHLKMFSGAFGAEVVSPYDVGLKNKRANVLANCSYYLSIPAIMETLSGDGVVVVSRIQLRSRLKQIEPATGLYSRRVDPVAQKLLLNMLSTYLDTASNWDRIHTILGTLPLYVEGATTSSVQEMETELFGPENAVDGNLATRWSSELKVDPQWITLDLGKLTKFNKIKLYWEYAYAKSYKIQASTDGTNWTDVYSTTSGDGVWDEIDLASTVIARYVRMFGTERALLDVGYSLWEFEVHHIPKEELGSIDFDKTSYTGTTEEAVITVVDADLNTDSTTRQTVNIKITSGADPTGITMTLTEINNNSDTFTSQATGKNLKFSLTSSNDTTETIKVKEAGLVTATYNDASPVGTQSTSVIWYTGQTSTNLALGKTATASSQEREDLAPQYAVDGNLNTRWGSGHSDPQWIQIDLGSIKTINKVVLNWESAYGKSYKVQLSTDGANWNDVYVTTYGNGYIDEIYFYPQDAQYVRMFGTERATTYGYSLWEFEVYYVTEGVPFRKPPSTGPVQVRGRQIFVAYISLSHIAQNTAEVIWTTDEVATTKVGYSTTSGGPYTYVEDTTYTTSHRIALTGLSAGTTYYYVVKSKDPQNNEFTSNENSFNTKSGTDTQKPTISNVSISYITGYSAEVTWATDEVATTKVGYSTTSGGPYTYVEDITYTTSHRIALTGLSTGTTYYYVVKSKDPQKNEAITDERIFTTE